jgi:hypothetical protein
MTFSTCPNMNLPDVSRVHSFHITLALLLRGLWHLKLNDEALTSKARSLALEPPYLLNRSLAPDSPELYLTKEALESRLQVRLHDGYWGEAYKRFVEIGHHSD